MLLLSSVRDLTSSAFQSFFDISVKHKSTSFWPPNEHHLDRSEAKWRRLYFMTIE